MTAPVTPTGAETGIGIVTGSDPAGPPITLAGNADQDGTALLIIDMISLMDFQTAGEIAASTVAAARRIAGLRRQCHERGWPVIFANDNFSRWQADFRELVAMARARGGAAATLVDLLPPLPQDYFVLKPKHSAFLASPLPVLLAKLNVKRLLITGVALESCVLATALDANARQFQVAIVRDGVAGLPELHAATLQVLNRSHAATLVEAGTAMAWAGNRPD